jgi:hypothetical protein
MTAEWSSFGSRRHPTFIISLDRLKATPTRSLARMHRARFPVYEEPSGVRSAAEQASSLAAAVLRHWASRGNAAAAVDVSVAPSDAGAMADELGGQSWLRRGRFVNEEEGMPRLASREHGASVALSARAGRQRGVRVFRGGGAAAGRYDQVILRYPCRSPPLRRFVSLGTECSPASGFRTTPGILPRGCWVWRCFLLRTISHRFCFF